MDEGQVSDNLARGEDWHDDATDPLDGLKRFFEELPAAVISYSTAVGCFAMAAIIVRIAVHVFWNV